MTPNIVMMTIVDKNLRFSTIVEEDSLFGNDDNRRGSCPPKI